MTPDERIDLALENRLPPEAWGQLQADVLADPALRATYAERASVHGQLRAERHTLPALLDEPASIPPPSRFPSLALGAAIAALAASLVTALTLPALLSRNAPASPVAILIEARDCKWAGSDLPTAEGSRLGPGTLALVEGMASLRFESGAILTLEAPSVLEIVSPMRCRLLEGSLTADVPESAHGFTVDTPDLKVVDLGTRFGVTASSFGNSHVLVFDGEVEVARETGPPSRLTTGNSLHLGSPPGRPDQEVIRAPSPQPAADGWTAIPTSFGRGKDAYIRRGDPHGPTGDHPLLMVKHTTLAAKNERRAFLTFDLSAVTPATLTDAALLLDVEASGLGFSALVPDSRFTVYGLTDDFHDDWSESGLLWTNAPASLEDRLDQALTTPLASFTIRRGAAPPLIEVSSPELLHFLQSQTNQLATLILVRETGESEPQGLVHAFASKEHPSALPPTLRVQSPSPQP